MTTVSTSAPRAAECEVVVERERAEQRRPRSPIDDLLEVDVDLGAVRCAGPADAPMFCEGFADAG